MAIQTVLHTACFECAQEVMEHMLPIGFLILCLNLASMLFVFGVDVLMLALMFVDLGSDALSLRL